MAETTAPTKPSTKANNKKAKAEAPVARTHMYKGIDYSKLPQREQAAFRRKTRAQLRGFIKDHAAAVASNDKSKVKDVLTGFVAFYKATYAIQDFSLKSCYSGSDEGDIEGLTSLLGAAQAAQAKA